MIEVKNIVYAMVENNAQEKINLEHPVTSYWAPKLRRAIGILASGGTPGSPGVPPDSRIPSNFGAQ